MSDELGTHEQRPVSRDEAWVSDLVFRADSFARRARLQGDARYPDMDSKRAELEAHLKGMVADGSIHQDSTIGYALRRYVEDSYSDPDQQYNAGWATARIMEHLNLAFREEEPVDVPRLRLDSPRVSARARIAIATVAVLAFATLVYWEWSTGPTTWVANPAPPASVPVTAAVPAPATPAAPSLPPKAANPAPPASVPVTAAAAAPAAPAIVSDEQFKAEVLKKQDQANALLKQLVDRQPTQPAAKRGRANTKTGGAAISGTAGGGTSVTFRDCSTAKPCRDRAIRVR